MRRTLLTIPYSGEQVADLNILGLRSAPDFRQVRPRNLSRQLKETSPCNTSLWRRPPTTLMSQVVAKLVVDAIQYLLHLLQNLVLLLVNFFPGLGVETAELEILLLAVQKLPSALLPRVLKR